VSGGLPSESHEPPRLSWSARISFLIGVVGLIGAASADAIAVVGRHLRWPLLGSVEIVQACMVLTGGAAIVAATLAREHASVRVITDRLPRAAQGALARFANLAAALFVGVLTAGSAWIMWDLRDGAEHTEILGLPLVALRGFWVSCGVICTVLFVLGVFEKRTP
jgi:TRAP-type C4-dicarboxylate transport system permease small subunit